MSDRARFDELIHPATRLSIVALLAAADRGTSEKGVEALTAPDSRFATLRRPDGRRAVRPGREAPP